jgi:hypothetical protein
MTALVVAGVVLYSCPECAFDDESAAVVAAHMTAAHSPAGAAAPPEDGPETSEEVDFIPEQGD